MLLLGACSREASVLRNPDALRQGRIDTDSEWIMVLPELFFEPHDPQPVLCAFRESEISTAQHRILSEVLPECSACSAVKTDLLARQKKKTTLTAS